MVKWIICLFGNASNLHKSYPLSKIIKSQREFSVLYSLFENQTMHPTDTSVPSSSIGGGSSDRLNPSFSLYCSQTCDNRSVFIFF